MAQVGRQASVTPDRRPAWPRRRLPPAQVLMVLLALLGSACGGGTPLVVNADGVERWATVDRPPSASGRLPLLIVLHGATLDGPETRSLLDRHFAGRRDRLVVAYPDAQGPVWNDGSFAATMPRALVSGDDLGFLDRLIETLVAEGTVDPASVHLAGISNGGMMALRYACARAERIASVAVFLATMPPDAEARCRPSRPLDVVMVAGTADQISRWTGEVTFAGAFVLQQRLSVPASFAFWQRANRCTGAAPARALPGGADPYAPRVVLHAATGCAGGVETRLYEVRGGGHRVPGDAAWPVWWPLGTATLDIEAGALLLDLALRPRALPKS